MTTRVLVDRVKYEGGTIALGWGSDEDGNEVRFAGDVRPMSYINDALILGEEVWVELEPWSILG
jgi:hypothetical protein